MSKIVDKAKKVAGVAGAAAGAYEILVETRGKVLRDVGKPRDASLKIAKVPIFEVNAEGQRWLFGFIKLKDLKKRG